MLVPQAGTTIPGDTKGTHPKMVHPEIRQRCVTGYTGSWTSREGLIQHRGPCGSGNSTRNFRGWPLLLPWLPDTRRQRFCFVFSKVSSIQASLVGISLPPGLDHRKPRF